VSAPAKEEEEDGNMIEEGHTLWMWGKTPPPAMVARISWSSSSSPRMASCKCRGVIRFTRRSLAALPGHQRGSGDIEESRDIPASSRTSAVKYSMMAATYTAAFAPTRTLFAFLFLKNLIISIHEGVVRVGLTYGYVQQGTMTSVWYVCM